MTNFRRRVEDKLEDEEKKLNPPIPGYEEEAENAELPLRTKPVSVTRFNRKVVGAILALIALVTAFSLIYSFSTHPKKKVGGEGKSPETSQVSTPPPLVTEAPNTYAQAGKKLPPGVPRLPTVPNPAEMPKAGQGQPSGTVPPSMQTTPAFSGQNEPMAPGTPLPPPPQAVPFETSKAGAEASERKKELSEARKSPVEFSYGAGAERKASPEQLPVIPQIQPPQGGAPPQPQVAARDDQNMQLEKRAFSSRQKDDPYVKTTLLKPVSPYEIKAGTIFPATLKTGINSDLPGQITAQISENVFDTVTGRFLLVPQGTTIVGEYDSKVAYGQERVLVVWHRLILPNGNSISLEGMPGVDLSGYSGLKDRVNNHYWKLISGVVLGSVIGAGAQMATGGQGSPNTPPTFPQLAVSGAASNLNQAGQQITEKNLQLQPTIEIRPGMNVNVFATKDLILEPYK